MENELKILTYGELPEFIDFFIIILKNVQIRTFIISSLGQTKK